MNDRYIIFSDAHIYHHAGNWENVDLGLNVVKWVLKEAIEKNIKTVFFLGDWFHLRGTSFPTVMAKTYETLLEFKNNGIELIFNLGNHDMFYRANAKGNSLIPFKPIISLVEQPSVFEGEAYNFYILPYCDGADRLRWAINKVYDYSLEHDNGKKNILLAHADIIGAQMSANLPSTHGITAEELTDKFLMSISGHYHSVQTLLDNIYYVGSPYMQNFGEAGQPKGYFLFDDGNLEFIENTFSPKYLSINESQIGENIRNNYVRITVSKDSNIAAVKEKALQFAPRNFSIQMDTTTHASVGGLVEINSDAKDISLLLREWLDKNANSSIFDKEKLYQVGIDIVNSVTTPELTSQQ